MNIGSSVRVLEVIHQPKNVQLGLARVIVDEKIVFYAKILRRKDGSFYCTMPSIYIDGHWDDAFSILDKDVEKRLLKQVEEGVNDFKEKLELAF